MHLTFFKLLSHIQWTVLCFRRLLLRTVLVVGHSPQFVFQLIANCSSSIFLIIHVYSGQGTEGTTPSQQTNVHSSFPSTVNDRICSHLLDHQYLSSVPYSVMDDNGPSSPTDGVLLVLLVVFSILCPVIVDLFCFRLKILSRNRGTDLVGSKRTSSTFKDRPVSFTIDSITSSCCRNTKSGLLFTLGECAHQPLFLFLPKNTKRRSIHWEGVQSLLSCP